MYLDSYETMTIFHMQDLVSGAKMKIKSKDVKHFAVPQYKGLSISNMLDFATQFPQVLSALPIPSEVAKLSRQYLANIIYTLVGDPFKTWVENRVELRNQEVTSKKNMMIEMDADIAQIFRESTAVPSKY